MKVLHIIAQLPDKTGSGIYYRNLVNGFEDLGAVNALVYANQAPFKVDFNHAQHYPVHFQTDQLPFPIVGMSDEMPYESTRYSQMSQQMIQQWRHAFCSQLVKVGECFQPDVVICHHLWWLTSLVLEYFENKIPVIGISHGTDLRQAGKNPHLAQAYLNDFNKLAAVFALSHSDAIKLKATFGLDSSKIKVMGAGFDPTIFNGKGRVNKSQTQRLLYAGKIAQAKGVFELAAAFPILKKRFPQLELTICGNSSDNDRTRLYQLSQAQPGFEVLPAQPQVKLAQLMQTHDIFVLPSYYEGIALINIEALACRMRVVTTQIPALQQLLGERVNRSGVIEYVDLPRLYEMDKPIKEDIPAFITRLVTSITSQLEKIKKEKVFPEAIYQNILTHAWPAIIQQQFHMACDLVERRR